MIALLCVAAILLSLVSYGWMNQKTESKAIAGVDDVFFGTVIQLAVYLSSIAAGAGQTDVVTSRESAGITDKASAEDYVGEITSNPNFSKMFKFESPSELAAFGSELASIYAQGNYIIRKEWWNYLANNFDAIDGTSAIDFSKSLADVHATILKFPLPDNNDGDDGDDNEDDKEENDTDSNESATSLVLPGTAISTLISSKLFKAVYYLVKNINVEKADIQFNPNYDTTKDIDISEKCDYSYDYWTSHNHFMDMGINCDTGYKNIYFMFNNLSSLSSYHDLKIFPCIYWNSDKSIFYIQIAFNNDSIGTINNFLKYGSETYNEKGVRTGGGSNTATIEFNSSQSTFVGKFNDEILSLMIKGLLSPETASLDIYRNVECDNLIRCETRSNFEKFNEMIQTGKYDYEELLDLMEDGWKSEKDSSWSGIQDGGETAKKVLESEKGDKYKTKGKAVQSDGKETTKTGINFDSIVSGVQDTIIVPDTGNEIVNVPSIAGQELFGDIIYDFPSEFPDSFGDTEPETNPDTGTETEPSTGTENNPSTGTENNPSTGAENNPSTGTETNTDTDNTTNNIYYDDSATTTIPGTDDSIQWYERFPFCVPWDIYNGVKVLNAETKAPVFTIPFQFKRFNIDESVTIDFTQYSSLRVIVQWFLRIIYALGLIMITRYVIKG